MLHFYQKIIKIGAPGPVLEPFEVGTKNLKIFADRMSKFIFDIFDHKKSKTCNVMETLEPIESVFPVILRFDSPVQVEC